MTKKQPPTSKKQAKPKKIDTSKLDLPFLDQVTPVDVRFNPAHPLLKCEALLYTLRKTNYEMSDMFDLKPVHSTYKFGLFSRELDKTLKINLLPLPGFMRDWGAWEYLLPNEVKERRFFPDFSINHEAMDRLPDIYNIGVNLTVFSESAKAVIEKYAPSRCIFYPMNILSKKTQEMSDKKYYGFLPRNVFFLETGDRRFKPDLDFRVGRFRWHVYRCLQEDPNVRQYVNDLSLFSVGECKIDCGFTSPFFSRGLFIKLKEAGLSGLKEKTTFSTSKSDDPKEVVRHVW